MNKEKAFIMYNPTHLLATIPAQQRNFGTEVSIVRQLKLYEEKGRFKSKQENRLTKQEKE